MVRWNARSTKASSNAQNLMKLLPKAMEIYRKSPLRTKKLEDEKVPLSPAAPSHEESNATSPVTSSDRSSARATSC